MKLWGLVDLYPAINKEQLKNHTCRIFTLKHYIYGLSYKLYYSLMIIFSKKYFFYYFCLDTKRHDCSCIYVNKSLDTLQDEECQYYTWFDQTAVLFKNECFLFTSCEKVNFTQYESRLHVCLQL